MYSGYVLPVTFVVVASLASGIFAGRSFNYFPPTARVSQFQRPVVANWNWFNNNNRQRTEKRGPLLNKCQQYSACALLQANPSQNSYWVDEICLCAPGDKCSLEWDDVAADGKSINNADTQLKLCQPISTYPTCVREQTAVSTAMETSVANPSIKQSASVFCNCPRETHEYKLIDAGMNDEGDRTTVTAQFGCAPNDVEPASRASF